MLFVLSQMLIRNETWTAGLSERIERGICLSENGVPWQVPCPFPSATDSIRRVNLSSKA